MNTLLKVCPYAKQEEVAELIADIDLEEASTDRIHDPLAYKEKLLKITKEFKNFAPALLELAS